MKDFKNLYLNKLLDQDSASTLFLLPAHTPPKTNLFKVVFVFFQISQEGLKKICVFEGSIRCDQHFIVT